MNNHALTMIMAVDRLQNDSDETAIQTIPTIGFNVEVLQYKNIKFQVCVREDASITRRCLAYLDHPRSGILEDKPASGPIGDVIIPILTR